MIDLGSKSSNSNTLSCLQNTCGYVSLEMNYVDEFHGWVGFDNAMTLFLLVMFSSFQQLSHCFFLLHSNRHSLNPSKNRLYSLIIIITTFCASLGVANSTMPKQRNLPSPSFDIPNLTSTTWPASLKNSSL